MAMLASSSTPLLLLDASLSVVAASETFCRAFVIDPETVRTKRFRDLGAGEWNQAQLEALLTATASGLAAVEAYELNLKPRGSEPRRLVLNAQKLDYGDPDNVRLLVSITDVTAIRAKAKLTDDLLREKAIMLQELQHRVANSLQIIASVLMQSARRVQSEETRGHLQDAHNRVMSIASLQRHLAASTLGDVVLRSYLRDLCWSIGASMIHDPNQIKLNVTTDDSVVGADASVSLGLIVTELVINALKHAFPAHRRGTITVDYRSYGPEWTLSVSDDGVGMPEGEIKPGLGTSIVQALAAQQNATITVTPSNPGTVVAVIHTDPETVEAVRH